MITLHAIEPAVDPNLLRGLRRSFATAQMRYRNGQLEYRLSAGTTWNLWPNSETRFYTGVGRELAEREAR